MIQDASQYKGWRILVTRPQAQAQAWIAHLQARGFSAEAVNLLAIVPVTDVDAVQAIKNCVMNLDNYAKVIFVSQNAVEQGMNWIDRYWPQLPINVSFLAVGATTAKLLASYGVAVEDLAVASAGSMTSESLLQAASLQAPLDEKILIMRGQGGRGHIAETLRQRGAKVDYCELYQRELPTAAVAQLRTWLHRYFAQLAPSVSPRDILSVHSGESLQNLQQLMAELATELKSEQREHVFDIPLLVPSERVAQSAQLMGWQKVIVAENATDAAMTQALEHYCT